MFPFLGKLVTRFWPLLLAAWLLLLGASWGWAPKWDAVTLGGDTPFLPEDSTSRRGEQLFKEAFPNAYSASNIVLVVSREGDSAGLRDEDRQFITQTLTPALKDLARHEGESVIARIRTPEEQGIGALLLSRDRQAALVLVELAAQFRDRRSWGTVEQIEGQLDTLRQQHKAPAGLSIALSGSATAGRDVAHAELKSAHDVEVWTIVVVVALLLLTYRAPLVAIIPLATVFVAVQVALASLALLAQAHILTLSRDLRIFITVIAYGAGVDYCVFLIARYQEELDRGAEAPEAVARSIGLVGGTVSASAGTVICGIGMLAFARFGKIHDAGLVIPLTLILVLAAALTFTPALLCLTGRWTFWPQGLRESATNGSRFGLLRHHLLPNVWQRIGPALSRRPGLIWLTAVALMTPLAIVAGRWYNRVDYDPISGLPPTAPSMVGARALERHFSTGILGPITILLENDRVNFAGAQGIALIRELTGRLETQKESLGIADLRSVARPLGITEAAREAVAKLPIPPSMVEALMRKRAVEYYVSNTGKGAGHVTRLDVVLAVFPFSQRGLDYLDRIEETLKDNLPDTLREGSQLSFSGPPATIRDLRAVTRGDQARMQVLVPIAVFLLLLLTFRRGAVSLYLILSVLFSYLTTLGATFLVFRLVEGESFVGLDWKVPLFLFTILVAVGEDYNIFLLSRVEEERKAHGPVRGVLVALARTGRIISTCGFIMAGTFAALFAGSFLSMKELGFALSVGVLLDTLVVRPILVPTFLILLQGRHPSERGAEHVLISAEEVR